MVVRPDRERQASIRRLDERDPATLTREEQQQLSEERAAEAQSAELRRERRRRAWRVAGVLPFNPD